MNSDYLNGAWFVRFNTDYELEIVNQYIKMGGKTTLLVHSSSSSKEHLSKLQILDQLDNTRIVNMDYKVKYELLTDSEIFFDIFDYKNFTDLIERASVSEPLTSELIKNAISFYEEFWREKLEKAQAYCSLLLGYSICHMKLF